MSDQIMIGASTMDDLYYVTEPSAGYSYWDIRQKKDNFSVAAFFLGIPNVEQEACILCWKLNDAQRRVAEPRDPEAAQLAQNLQEAKDALMDENKHLRQRIAVLEGQWQSAQLATIRPPAIDVDVSGG